MRVLVVEDDDKIASFIVKGLKQDATIAYFDQPRGFARAKDQLELYSNLSPKVHVKYVDADKDVTYIVIGAASVRMAAMDSGSVQASMMPAPWNVRMKQKGFKEMMFAGDVISDPLNGIVIFVA